MCLCLNFDLACQHTPVSTCMCVGDTKTQDTDTSVFTVAWHIFVLL